MGTEYISPVLSVFLTCPVTFLNEDALLKNTAALRICKYFNRIKIDYGLFQLKSYGIVYT